MRGTDSVALKDLVEKMKLKNLTPDIDMEDRKITVPDVNRPALQLTGFFEHFDSERVQVIGYVEYTYLQTLSENGTGCESPGFTADRLF